MMLLIIAGLLLLLLTLVSYVDRVYTEMGKFLSREFQQNIEVFEHEIEPGLKVSRARAALSMAVLKHICMSALSVLIAYALLRRMPVTANEIIQAAITLVLIIILCQHLLPFVLFARTRGKWIRGFGPLLSALIYLMFPVTIILGFTLSVAALSSDGGDAEPERPSEAVDALLEAGQEEGILEASDRDLIQSVVEFGDKTVREVMTARPDIMAVPADMSIEKFTELLRAHPYSRVPVYEGTLDHIVGILLTHDVLQIADVEARTRTAGEVMRKDVQFVPESKRVTDQLREMQAANNQMAIVIDEYGGVAGVVTIEDLVEEIVGEIHDEHDSAANVTRESERSYIVPGSMDVDRLDELFGVKPEEHEATTAAGLVTELLGRIPRAGETVETNGLRFEVLESTDRVIERLRISAPQPARTKSA